MARSAVQPTDPLARALALEGSFEFLQRPGLWLWLLIAAGVALRALLVVFTQGTYDALIWKGLVVRGRRHLTDRDRLMR